MTRNRKKAYRQMARGRMKEARGIMKFLRGLFIVKKADARFSFENWRKQRKERKRDRMTITARLGRAGTRSWIALKNSVKVGAYSAWMIMKGAASRLR